MNTGNFAVSPPFFDFSDPEEAETMNEKIDDMISDFLFNGKYFVPRVFCVFRFCFASICFHWAHLVLLLHPKNVLHSSPFFNSIPTEIKKAATIKYPWNKTKCTPIFTGIPPHVLLLVEMQTMRVQYDEMKSQLMNEIRVELDERKVGSQGFFDVEKVIHRMECLHTDLIQKMTSFGNVAGLTSYDEDGTFDRSDAEKVYTIADTITSTKAFDINVKEGKDMKYKLFIGRGGAMTCLPPDYTFPKQMPLANLIVMWYCGDKSRKVIPYSLLHPKDIQDKTMRYVLTKMRQMMQVVEAAAVEAGVWTQRPIRDWDVGLATELYQDTNKYFDYDPPNEKFTRRKPQLSWRSVLNMYFKNNKHFAGKI